MNMVCWGFLVMFNCQMPSPPPEVVACPSIVVWTRDYQRRVADQFAGLSDEMKQVLREHIQLRKKARECRDAQKKPGK